MKSISKKPGSVKRAAAAKANATHDAVRDARRTAYVAEADPLFFKLARGEAKQAEYDAKVAEIRARHPYEQE